jgi:TolB-like protein/Flp pilus assembly protein TadD
LPFENTDGDGDGDFFCDGFSEDIISQLTKVREVRVISWSSTIDYRNSEKALREISEELGVRSVLTGNFRRASDQLHLTLTLSDGATGESLWQEEYEGSISDYFIIQGKVVLQVADVLNAAVSVEEENRIKRIPTESIGAYECYLKGRKELDRQEKEGNQAAIELLNKALELDPDFALAYAGLGEAYLQRVQRHGSSATWLDSSVEMAEKAIALNPDMAEAHSTLSLVYYLKGWFSQALLQDRKAVAINPNLPSAIYGLGYDYLVLGDLAETLRWLRKAVKLDPRDAGNHQQIGKILMTLNKGDDAEWWFKKSLELEPDYSEARHQLGYLYLSRGNIEDASAETQQILSESLESLEGLDLAAAIELRRGNLEKVGAICQRMLKISSMGASYLTKVAAYRLGYVLWQKKRRKEASRLFEIQLRQHQDAMKKGDQSWVPRFFTASIYAVQGEKEMACTWLKKAIEAGFRECGYFDLFEDWDGLYGYEQFEETLGQFRGDLEKMRRRAEAMIGQHTPNLESNKTELRTEPNSGDQNADEGKE